jgi:ketosteroid isomerase-like protein
MSVEAEIRAVCEARDAALITNDASRIASFMTADWVYVGPDGITPRADIIGWIASGRLAHDQMTTVGVDHVVRAGDAVVVTARKISAGVWDGGSYTADEWISEIYVQEDATWRCAFSQKSPVIP